MSSIFPVNIVIFKSMEQHGNEGKDSRSSITPNMLSKKPVEGGKTLWANKTQFVISVAVPWHAFDQASNFKPKKKIKTT